MSDSQALPRYARWECERKWLVDPASDWKSHLKPYSKRLQDRYLSCGRLRLRVMTDSDSGRVVYKLTKKYETGSIVRKPIVTVLLSESEYGALVRLDGNNLEKTRHYCEFGGRDFAVDVFDGELSGLIVCEIEGDSTEELAVIDPPPFAGAEISGAPFFTGGVLCRASRNQLLAEMDQVDKVRGHDADHM